MIFLCALLFVLWLEELGGRKNPASMIEIEGNSRPVVLAKHIFGDDLENYFKRNLSRFNPLKRAWHAKVIQCDMISSQLLPGLDFAVDSHRNVRERFCQSHASADCLGRYIYSVDDCNFASIPEAEANLWPRRLFIHFAEFRRWYGDTRAVSYDKAIFRDFGGVMSSNSSNAGRFVKTPRIAVKTAMTAVEPAVISSRVINEMADISDDRGSSLF
jgi:hypothetical protein